MINKNEITSLFERFKNLTVLIIGDVMLDNYLIGKVNRISPEAPVPIVEINEKISRLGGAANVALNIKSLGATPLLFSVIGNDFNGAELTLKLTEHNITGDGILIDDSRPTTVKSRVISNKQQVLRFDEEITSSLSNKTSNTLIESIVNCISTNKPDVIIFEDYDKGVISEELITRVVSRAKQNNIPTVVDPKKKNFLAYKNVTLFKPNLRELEEGLNLVINKKEHQQIKDAVQLLSESLHFDQSLITLSDEGIFYWNNNLHFHLPAHLRNISDVSGAGDTVISVAALCLASKCNPQLLSAIANISGGLVCEKSGVVSIDLNELKHESIKLLC